MMNVTGVIGFRVVFDGSLGRAARPSRVGHEVIKSPHFKFRINISKQR